MTITELLQWQNLVFLLPGVAAIFYLLVLTFTGIGDGGHEFGGVDHDVDADTDVDHDMGVEHAHDIEHDGDADQSVFMKTLSFLGIGRVPISIIVLTFCISWAFLGWASNLWLSHLLPAFMYFWVSLAIAFLGSVLLTKATASTIGKFMPNTETYKTKKTDLVGKTGMTNYRVTETSGFAFVTDNYKGTIEVSCRVPRGQEPIPAGTKVVLNHYQREDDTYLICCDPLTALIEANKL